MNPQADFIRLEYSLGLSQKTSQGLLKLRKKTRGDVSKILWECERQMKLINDFSELEAFRHINGEERYGLRQDYVNAENIYYELSQR